MLQLLLISHDGNIVLFVLIFLNDFKPKASRMPRSYFPQGRFYYIQAYAQIAIIIFSKNLCSLSLIQIATLNIVCNLYGNFQKLLKKLSFLALL